MRPRCGGAAASAAFSSTSQILPVCHLWLRGHCEARGYEVLFLPKFHPELNFIEMCWGYGKRFVP